jgi:hypothetical protein
MESDWIEFQSIRQLDRERQNLEITRVALQHDQQSSESMCQELAAEKSGSEALLTKLKAEKQALEALLGMFCDAVFWLSDDGDTVVQSERRFDAVMGCNMLEQSLLSHFPSSEHERLKRAVCVEDVGVNSPVRLLTTKIHQLSSIGISAVSVELLIADRRHSSDLSIDLGYFVGLRLCQNSGSHVDSGLAVPSSVLASKADARTHPPPCGSDDLPQPRRTGGFSKPLMSTTFGASCSHFLCDAIGEEGAQSLVETTSVGTKSAVQSLHAGLMRHEHPFSSHALDDMESEYSFQLSAASSSGSKHGRNKWMASTTVQDTNESEAQTWLTIENSDSLICMRCCAKHPLMSEPSSADSYSLLPLTSSLGTSVPRVALASVGVQSTPCEGPPLRWSADAYCQTVEEAHSTARRPPTRPGSRARQQHPVILETRRRVLHNFKATPRRTIEDIIRQSLLYINSRGVGCCAFHIVLANAAHVMKGLATKSCDVIYSPFNTWQCHSCFAMNATTAEDGIDASDALECDMCGSSNDGLNEGGTPDVFAGSREVDCENSSADGGCSESGRSELLSD